MCWLTVKCLLVMLTWYSPARSARRVDAGTRAMETMQKRNVEHVVSLMRRSRDVENKGGANPMWSIVGEKDWPKDNSDLDEQLHLFLHSNLRGERTVDKRDVHSLLKLTKDESLEVMKESVGATGAHMERLQEFYRDTPVYDGSVTVRIDDNNKLTGDASGTIVEDIDKDLPDMEVKFTDQDTLQIAVDREGDNDKEDEITDVSFKKWVFLDENDQARLVNIVAYLIDGLKRPFYVIDLKTGEVLKNWNALTTIGCGKKEYNAFGGNRKQGRVKYGDVPFCLNMTIDHSSGTCYLENEYVRVVEMNNSRKAPTEEAASFPCKDGYHDAVNDGYSPAIDVFFHATIVGKMFEEWLGDTPHDEKQIVARVHYREHYENAFWNGVNCTFGDGYSMFYPLTSLDIVGHEIGHGTTEMNSALIYSGESGGINEAFSDMMGEAAEAYLLSNDWFVGNQVMKNRPYLREFERPENDNISISHVDDMYEEMDSHFSSGVYRRVWYVLVKQKGVPVREAFHAFFHANKMYWHHSGSFYDCSCGVLRAAIDLGLSTTPFRRAFKDVGIANCDVSNHIFHLANNITQHDVTVSDTMKPVFRFELPTWSQDLIVTVNSPAGKYIKVIVQNGTWEGLGEYETDNASIIGEGYNEVVIYGVSNGTLYIELSTDELATEHNVDVLAGYTCNHDFYSGSSMESFLFKYYCYGTYPEW